MTSSRRGARPIVAAVLVVSLCSTLSACGESQNCWCRCPSGNLVEFSEVSSSPPSCEELCSENGCFYEGCSSGESQFCECSEGLMGTQVCDADGVWTPCSNCTSPPECLEGQRTTCVCDSGVGGWRHCEAGSWGTCEGCDTDCTPGLSRQCPCEGGLTGTQTCDPSGAWSECTSCSAPAVCEDGQEDICACENDQTGVQSCVAGQWGPCTQCETALIHADVDFGNEGMSVGGAWFDIFDTTEWGCPSMEPNADSLIWRIFLDDGANPETIRFEFELPETAGNVEVTFWEMSITGELGASEMEVYVNGSDASDSVIPHDGCVDATDATIPAELFLPGATNRIEVWSANNGRGQFHGLQGVWVWYNF